MPPSQERLLYILRHAKAEAYDLESADAARSLSPDGESGAALVGQYAASRHRGPDAVLCSPSTRTRQTWEIVARESGWQAPVSFPAELYLASAGELMGFIQSLPETAQTALIVGHNPGLHDLCLTLANNPGHPLHQSMRLKFSPGSFAVLALEAAHWADAAPGRFRLIDYTKPSTLS